MNIAPLYPNFVPLALQPTTEAAARDSALRERIPALTESGASHTGNSNAESQLKNSSDSSPRFASTAQQSNADTYSLSSLKNSSIKKGEETILPSTDTATAVSDDSKEKQQATADDDSATSSDSNTQKSQKEEKAIKELKERDTEVRTHEQAHKSAGGQYAGAPAFEMTKGPDGESYATGGHVNIDVSPIADDPQATINKMSQIKSAALAPAEPSSQDLKVAAKADRVAAAARSELAKSSSSIVSEDQSTDVSMTDSTKNLISNDDLSMNAQMRRRSQIILAHYQSSSRPYA